MGIRWSVVEGLVVLGAFVPAVQAADSWPASTRACAAETDVLKRLSCYDKEAVRYARPPQSEDTQRGSPTGGAATGATATGSASAGSASTGSASTGGAAVASGAPSPVADPFGLPPPPKKEEAPRETRQISARVVSIEQHRGNVLLHLDNGQVWQQIQTEDVPDLNLHVGSTVKIEKDPLGSYWLSAGTTAAAKVKRTQ